MNRKTISALLLITLLFITSSCWNRRDPELLALVLATAFDYREEEDLYQIIVQIANPLVLGENGNNGGGNPGEKPFWVLSAYGLTPFMAMRNLAEGSSRELFWAHNSVLLFSEEMARHGIQPVLDLFARERQLRLIALPAVVDGDIRKIMEAEYPLEEMGSVGLQRQMITVLFQRALFPTKPLREIYNELTQPGKEISIGRITLLDNDGENEEENEDGENGDPEVSPSPPAHVGGAAIFRDDKMVGWIAKEEGPGGLYITGRAQRSTIVVESPEEDGHRLSVELLFAHRTWQPVGEGEDVRIQLEILTEGRIQDYHGEGGLEIESRVIHSIQNRVAENIKKKVKLAIDRSQELNADALGFGNLIYRKRPSLWEEIGPKWDQLFPELEVDIDVNVRIERAGQLSDPVKRSR